MTNLLFLRDFKHFSGGHLKVWDYFQHALQSSACAPRICFTSGSHWDSTNPWRGIDERLLAKETEIESANMLFVAGNDWLRLSPEQRERPPHPIINLVQHVRHADKNHELYQFLGHEAIRICVSQEVADAILATGRVRGPVYTIPNGIDLGGLPATRAPQDREYDWLVLGTKHRWLGRYFAGHLWRPSRRVRVVSQPLPRVELLAAFANSRKVLLLPDKTEGFYLPALEAMALGALVVCPDCIGNRSFCIDETNCLRPAPNIAAILGAIQRMEQLSPAETRAMRLAGYDMARDHNLVRERESFLKLLPSLMRLSEASA